MSVPKHYTDRDLEWLIKEAASGQESAACRDDMLIRPRVSTSKVSDGYGVFRVTGEFPSPCAQIAGFSPHCRITWLGS